jgi:hypothetical protein
MATILYAQTPPTQVIAMVTTFFICVMMMLPLLMIRNVRAKIILFKNNVTRLIVDVDYVLSRDAMLAYMKDYLPYFLWFGLQILPMFIFLFLMVYCACTIARRVIKVFTVFRLLTDFVCLYNYEF